MTETETDFSTMRQRMLATATSDEARNLIQRRITYVTEAAAMERQRMIDRLQETVGSVYTVDGMDEIRDAEYRRAIYTELLRAVSQDDRTKAFAVGHFCYFLLERGRTARDDIERAAVNHVISDLNTDDMNVTALASFMFTDA